MLPLPRILHKSRQDQTISAVLHTSCGTLVFHPLPESDFCEKGKPSLCLCGAEQWLHSSPWQLYPNPQLQDTENAITSIAYHEHTYHPDSLPSLLLHNSISLLLTSVGDPNSDLQDPHVFGPPGSGSGSIRVRIRIQILHFSEIMRA